MLSLKRHITIVLFTALAFINNASAGLYGFTPTNPYSDDEKILKIDVPPRQVPNFRETMRDNILMLSEYADTQNKNFKLIIHEGEELLSKSLWEHHLSGYNDAREISPKAKDPSFLYRLKNNFGGHSDLIGTPTPKYLRNLDGIVLNNAFCSNRKINPALRSSSLKIISFDFCPNLNNYNKAIQESISQNILLRAFTNTNTAFSNVEEQVIINENAKNIFNLNDAENLLFINDEHNYKDKFELIEKIRNTNFDIIIISPLFNKKTAYSKEEVDMLKFKKSGAQRLVFAVMNISEADPEMYYWNRKWKIGNPTWLRRLSFSNPKSVIAEYWQDDWKKIISLYFKSILDLEFDGAFLTGLENHNYFEQQLPLE